MTEACPFQTAGSPPTNWILVEHRLLKETPFTPINAKYAPCTNW